MSAKCERCETLMKCACWNWYKKTDVPTGPQMRNCGWAIKMKPLSEARACGELKDNAVTKKDDLYAPTPARITTQCCLTQHDVRCQRVRQM